MTNFGETSACHQSDVSAADYSKLHAFSAFDGIRLDSAARIVPDIFAYRAQTTKSGLSASDLTCIHRIRKNRSQARQAVERRRFAASGARSGTKCAPARKKPPQSKKQQARLAKRQVPEDASRFVTRIAAQGAARGCVHQIHQAAVIGLLEGMDGSANQKMHIEFAPKSAQLAAAAAIENRFADSERASKTGDDSADGADLNLTSGVTNQEDAAGSDSPFDGHPAAIHRNARTLKRHRLEMTLDQKSVQAFARVTAVFANQSERGSFFRFGNEPVEVRRVTRNEPDTHRVGRHVSRHFDDGLNQRHGTHGRPARGLSHAALRAVRADDGLGVDLLNLRRSRHAHREPQRGAGAGRGALQSEESATHRNLSAVALGLGREITNQARAFNN